MQKKKTKHEQYHAWSSMFGLSASTIQGGQKESEPRYSTHNFVKCWRIFNGCDFQRSLTVAFPTNLHRCNICIMAQSGVYLH